MDTFVRDNNILGYFNFSSSSSTGLSGICTLVYFYGLIMSYRKPLQMYSWCVRRKKGSVLLHSLLPLPPSANFLGSPSCEVKSWKKVKKLKKHFVMFVYSTLYYFLVSVLIHVISTAIPSKVLFVSHFKGFLKTSFWFEEKKTCSLVLCTETI